MGFHTIPVLFEGKTRNLYYILELIMLNSEMLKAENMKILIISALKCFVVHLKINFSQTLACAVFDACLIILISNYFNSIVFQGWITNQEK